MTREAKWSRAVEAIFTLAESLDIRYPRSADISQAQQVYEILYNVTANLNENWVRLMNKEAYLIPFGLVENFTLQFNSQERVFTVHTNVDIPLMKQKKTVILLGLLSTSVIRWRWKMCWQNMKICCLLLNLSPSI